MKPNMTVEKKYEFVLEKLTRKFPDVVNGGVLESDGFSFDFPIPDSDSGITLSIQVGANEETQKGYVSGFVYEKGGEITLNEHVVSYKYDEDFESAVIRNLGFLLKQSRQHKEEE